MTKEEIKEYNLQIKVDSVKHELSKYHLHHGQIQLYKLQNLASENKISTDLSIKIAKEMNLEIIGLKES